MADSWKKRFKKFGPNQHASKLNKLRHRYRKVHQKVKKRNRQNLPAKKAKERKQNIERKIKFLKENPPSKQDAAGTGVWKDGTRVAGWMMGLAEGPDGRTINWLQRYVDEGWDGNLSSGYRTPGYSESLCLNMCNAPSCPGRCAGRSSNHSGADGPGKKGNDSWGAIDVAPEYVKFEAIGVRINSPLINRLDYRDPVHFSVTGN